MSDEAPVPTQLKPRRWWLALLLAVIAPLAAYFYVGRPLRLLVPLSAYVLLLVAFATGLGGLLATPIGAVAAVSLVLLLAIGIAVDCTRLAVSAKDYELRRYNRWWIYLGLLILSWVGSSAIQPSSFAIRTFSVAAGSMQPGLVKGEALIADMTAFSSAKPERGDVVVFHLPGEQSTMWLKRVIGLPGDTVRLSNGVVEVNGEQAKLERLDDDPFNDELGKATRYRETLGNGASYVVLDRDPKGFGDNTPTYLVQPGRYFLLGDDRDNSTDSRIATFGNIPTESILGKASFVFWPLNSFGRPVR